MQVKQKNQLTTVLVLMKKKMTTLRMITRMINRPMKIFQVKKKIPQAQEKENVSFQLWMKFLLQKRKIHQWLGGYQMVTR